MAKYRKFTYSAGYAGTEVESVYKFSDAYTEDEIESIYNDWYDEQRGDEGSSEEISEEEALASGIEEEFD